MLVAISNAKTGWQRAVVETDARGRFAADLPAGDYAVAIASPYGFSFIEQVVAPSAGVLVKLSPECHPARGRIVGHGTSLANVFFSRYSSFTGDRFAAPSSPDGSFQLCLPAASYTVRVDGASVSQTHPLELPTSRTIEIPAWPRTAIEASPEAGARHSAPVDVSSFVKALARGPRLIGLGEANHGCGDFYTQRGALSLALAREGDLRYILLEADAVGLMAIDDYVHGQEIDLAKSVAKLRFWITDIREFHQILNDVRSYNRAVPPARRVHVLGFDAQWPDSAVELLLGGRTELGLTKAEVELLQKILRTRRALSKLASVEVQVLEALIERVGDVPASTDLLALPARAAIAARSLRHQLGYVGKASNDNLRDAAMADLTALVIQLGGPGQATLWAHNGHVAREEDGGTVTLGQHLARRFADYYPVAFLANDGEARAWDAAGAIGVIPHALGLAPPYNVEAAIMAATGSPDIAWVRIADVSGPLRQWFELPRYVRELGAVLTRATQTLRRFPEAFDAVVVIKRASASTPTPTGERRVKP